MEIAIIADDTKKELITQFCIAYCGILSKHSICATSTTGSYIAEATGLKIEKLLSGTLGGEQQMGTQIVNNDIDLTISIRSNILTIDTYLLYLATPILFPACRNQEIVN